MQAPEQGWRPAAPPNYSSYAVMPTAPPYPEPTAPPMSPYAVHPTAPPESPQVRVVPLPTATVPQVRVVPLPNSRTSIERAFPTPTPAPARAPAPAQVRRRPTTAPTINRSTRYVAKGAFGCVVDPALPNYNADTNSWKTFPHEVTKMFYNEHSKRKAVNASQRMYDATGQDNNNILVHPYHYDDYRYGALPGSVTAQCGIDPSQYYERMYPVHMKHLGVDATNLQSVVSDFHKIPVLAIMREMRRLMQQVVQLKRRGYIHGDIRETNVMFNHVGPKFTIIDYDWLRTADSFFSRYPLGYYSNPPESVLNNDYDFVATTSSATTQRAIIDIHKTTIRNYVRHSNEQSTFRQTFNVEYTVDMFTSDMFGPRGSITYYRDTLHARTRQDFLNALFETFDSYGLGLALCEFCAVVYARGTADLTNNGIPYSAADTAVLNNVLNWLVATVLLPMCAFNRSQRITPEVAIERINAVIQMYEDHMTPSLNALGGPIPALQGSAPHIGGRVHRTRRRRSTRTRSRRHKK